MNTRDYLANYLEQQRKAQLELNEELAHKKHRLEKDAYLRKNLEPERVTPNTRAVDYGFESTLGIIKYIQPALERAYIAGWSAALDSLERHKGGSVDTDTIYSPDLTAKIAPLIEKAVSEAFARSTEATFPNLAPAPTPPLYNPNAVGPTLPPGYEYIYHKRGEYPCFKPAFILTRKIHEGERVDPLVFRYLTGLPIPIDAPSQCGSCLREVHPYSNSDLEWEPHIIPGPPRTLTGYFRNSTDPDPSPSKPPTTLNNSDLGFPSVPDPDFNLQSGEDIPDYNAPGELGDQELQAVLALKEEINQYLEADNPWTARLPDPEPEEGNNGSLISGS